MNSSTQDSPEAFYGLWILHSFANDNEFSVLFILSFDQSINWPTLNIIDKKESNQIPFVSGSCKKTSKQSIKLVPLNGSPPIPEKVEHFEIQVQMVLKKTYIFLFYFSKRLELF